ncbi:MULTISPECIES: hypothetical protein [Photobacterium]|uniref:Lacal_2735 family protein n=1 Tax=Photobacterium piscicola TaxID=1378299 RepID=A0ABU6LKD3_9GAMM|nr:MULTISPECIES: hypothetical protein [Photobacterium]MCD9527563.1 hypothetical protein [Photobacterium carnosum]MEC6899994.1 hypothetical protein [Photobacterium piscicola]
MKRQFVSFEQYKKKALQDPEIKKNYDDLAEEFKLISDQIALQKQSHNNTAKK